MPIIVYIATSLDGMAIADMARAGKRNFHQGQEITKASRWATHETGQRIGASGVTDASLFVLVSGEATCVKDGRAAALVGEGDDSVTVGDLIAFHVLLAGVDDRVELQIAIDRGLVRLDVVDT